MSPDQVLAFADKLSGAGIAALLILILWLGSTRRWVWGYQLADCEARRVAEVTAARERELEWKAIAREGLATARTGLEVAKDRKP